MKPFKNWQKSLAAAAIFSLITAFPAASTGSIPIWQK